VVPLQEFYDWQRRGGANEKEVYRIGDVSKITAREAVCVRYWRRIPDAATDQESERAPIVPARRRGQWLLKIKRLLYDEGFTIAGARRHLRDGGAAEHEAPAVIPPGHGATSVVEPEKCFWIYAIRCALS